MRFAPRDGRVRFGLAVDCIRESSATVQFSDILAERLADRSDSCRSARQRSRLIDTVYEPESEFRQSGLHLRRLEYNALDYRWKHCLFEWFYIRFFR